MKLQTCHLNMTGRGDPFDFNDIYTKLGADGLVHKPMKAQEVKKPTHNYTGGHGDKIVLGKT